jgi:hypothetical protein
MSALDPTDAPDGCFAVEVAMGAGCNGCVFGGGGPGSCLGRRCLPSERADYRFVIFKKIDTLPDLCKGERP